MPLSVDPRRIVSAVLVPFEVDEDSYGIGWKLDDGAQGADLIGNKAETKALLREIAEKREAALTEGLADIIQFPKDTAAS